MERDGGMAPADVGGVNGARVGALGAMARVLSLTLRCLIGQGWLLPCTLCFCF